MKKKEFKVEEVFQCGLIKLKVKIGEPFFLCRGCYCGEMANHNCDVFKDIVGECMSESREDKTDVIFVKVEE